MKLLSFSFYDPATGLFHGSRFSCSNHAGHADDLRKNTPAGAAALEGSFDSLRHRVDIATGAVVDYQPPAPSDDHEWRSDEKSWVLKPEVLEAKAADAQARTRIAAEETLSLRAMRELLLDPANAEARAKVQAAEAAIAAERPKISTKGDVRERD